MTRKFAGFPKHNGKPVPLPAAFFSELLPLIDDLAELKVTLFCFWALYQKEGRFRYLRRRDFANNTALMDGLRAADPATDPQIALDFALDKACERGTILCADVKLGSGADRLYFVNTVLGRMALDQIAAGEWRPGDAEHPLEILPQRPNVFQLYEDNIGPLTPMIADALKDAQGDYPSHWIEDAMRVAVENNARNWRYVMAVLERWRAEGRSGEITEKSTPDGRRYVSGTYADFIEH
jgi:DnaD/phage-associated family protein